MDFSTILPAQDWINTLSSSIGIEIDSCGSNLPLFLLDSEGMGVRGDKFDSLTSGPPAILAKQIIYVGEHTLVTQEILNSVGKYLDSLSGIIGGTGDDGNPDDYSCDVPVLETFILVINKLSDNTPDEELYRVVFTPEPEIDEEAAERNDVRQKLQTCFSGTNVVGIPQEQLGDGESMDYPYLSQRFKEELATLANLIVATLEDPHIVPVEGARLFNSTNAEGIIDTLVYQANSGAISLQGNPYIESAQAEVTALLGEANSHLYNLEPNCEQLATGYSCTNCVCSYRNEFLELTLNDIDDILTQANADSLNEFSEDISSQLEQFKSDMVDPWSIANYCFPEKIFYKSKQDDQICDISTMQDVLTQPGTNVALFCNQIFFCSTSTVSLTGLAVTATTVYIEAGYRIEAVQPNQAESGPDGATYGANGGNGYPGLPGPNITVEGDILLETPRSEYVITYMTQGGKGGNGGNGHIGDPESGFAKPSATTIVTTGSLYGSQYDVAQPGCGHCHGYTCHCHEWKQDYEIVLTKSACGGNGGNAGVGGSPGNLVVTGAIADLVQISLEPSTTDGDVGLGGTGSTFEMQYIATE